MKAINKEIIMEAARAFLLEGRILNARPYGGGHINDTFAVECEREGGSIKRYILQRINTNVFRNPIQLMENIVGVTNYLGKLIEKQGGDPMRETPQLFLLEDKNWYVDSQGRLENLPFY